MTTLSERIPCTKSRFLALLLAVTASSVATAQTEPVRDDPWSFDEPRAADRPAATAPVNPLRQTQPAPRQAPAPRYPSDDRYPSYEATTQPRYPQPPAAAANPSGPAATVARGPQTGQPTPAQEATNAQAPTANTDAAQADNKQWEPTAALKQVEQRIAAVQDASDIEEDEKSETVKVLKEALDWLKIASEAEQKKAALKSEAANVPRAVEQARVRLDQPPSETRLEFPPDATLVQLEQYLAEAEQALTMSQQALDAQQAELKHRTERQGQLAKWLAEASARLAETAEQLENSDTSAGQGALAEARWLSTRARHLAARQQVEMYQAETIRHKAVAELLPLKRDLAMRSLTQIEQQVRQWQEMVRNYRKFAAKQQARRAQELVDRVAPGLREIAEKMADYAEHRVEIVEKIDAASQDVGAAEARLEQVHASYQAIKEKVDGAGLSLAIGLSLRKHRRELPQLDKFRQRLATNEAELASIQLDVIELQEARERLADLDGEAERTHQTAIASSAGSTVHVAAVRQLLQGKRDFLDDLINDYDAYQDILSDLDVSARKLVETTTEFQCYIDEHVLWVRSTEPLTAADLRSSLSAAGAMVQYSEWQGVAHAIWVKLRDRWAMTLTLVAGIVGLFLIGGKMGSRIERMAEPTAGDSEISLRPLLEAAVLTLLIAAIWPSSLFLLSWLLAETAGAHQLAQALADAFALTGALFFAVEILRQTCRPAGLAEQHFGWPASTLRSVRANLHRLVLCGLPILFTVVLARTYQNGAWADSLGRLAFMLGMLLIAWTLYRLGRKSGGLFEHFGDREATGSLLRFRWAWYPLLVATPLGLALLAGLGYHYSASQLALRAKATFWCFLIVLLGCSFLTRIVRVVSAAMMRRQRSEAERAVAADSAVDAEASPTQEDQRAEWEQLTAQALRLLRGAAVAIFLATVWFTWAQVLPAFQFLDRVELWTVAQEVSETVTDPDGNETTRVKSVVAPVTLKEMLLALLVFYATAVAARNLPGLLQIAILNRLPIDHGGRHAVAMICRYLLIVSGCVLGCQIIGVSWSSVQWLVAAMTVGLGFGLQEIFANFVSGLIILFERPIRVGDLVTVGGTTGHVARIEIRATTIRDFDRRELVVPNKNFVTSEVMNWTLSDPVTRVVIPVGVAYGSDTALTHTELMNVASGHPLVLRDPEPSAVFIGFGASTLDFELRFFIGSRDVYGKVLHEINTAIDQAFRAANLEIAFPQQDIHIRSIEAALPKIAGEPAAGESTPGDTSAATRRAA